MADRNGWRNWSGNSTCRPAAVEVPRSELEVVEALRRAAVAAQRVRVVGTGHSFNDIACTEGRMLRLDELTRFLAVDAEAGTVTVEAGMPLWRINDELAARGLALANLGDVDRQTIAGAIATGTHGTGVGFGSLPTFVRALELVTPSGEVLRCSPTEEPEVFRCARVGLGALGVVTKVTLACMPEFRLHAIEGKRDYAETLASLDDLVDANEHFEFFWWPHTEVCTTKRNNRTTEPVRRPSRNQTWVDEAFLPNAVFGAACWIGRALPDRVPLIARGLSRAMGRREVVDRSDRVFCSPRFVRFVETEYAVPRERTREAVEAVRSIIDAHGLRISFPVEVRFGAADDIPLSPAFGRDTGYVAVHVHAGTEYRDYFGAVADAMRALDGRPHWGKLHDETAASLAPRYPEWERFRAVRDRLDPERRFANAYLDRVLGPA